MDVVQAIVGAAKRSLINIPVELLDSVRERTLDKKVCPVSLALIVYIGFKLTVFISHPLCGFRV